MNKHAYEQVLNNDKYMAISAIKNSLGGLGDTDWAKIWDSTTVGAAGIIKALTGGGSSSSTTPLPPSSSTPTWLFPAALGGGALLIVYFMFRKPRAVLAA